MTWVTARHAADALRDLVRDPHPRKFRAIFNADTILRMIDLLDPPPTDDPVRDTAKALLRTLDLAEGREERAQAMGDLERALAVGPPSTAAELTTTRQLLAAQGAQLARMGIAIKMARTFGLSAVALPETEIVKAFLRGWIDDGSWPPLAWPDATKLPVLARWLHDQGFANIGGAIGIWLTSNREDPQPGRDYVT